MNKICTSLEQSKKLIELGIDRKSSDMYYWCGSDLRIGGHRAQDEKWDTPAWSLTSLMKLMPKVSTDGDEIYESYPIMEHDDEGFAVSSPIYNTSYYSEPIDAAFEMVVWLKENGKI